MKRLFMRRTRRKKEGSRSFWMENDRLFLKELIKSSDGKRNPILIFSSEDLAKATCNYHLNLIIHKEGLYDLYRTKDESTTHNWIIQVAKFKGIPDRDQRHRGTHQMIINELVVMSQINHKNVVKLLGCCLETLFPILVYENCHSNGTLSDRVLQERCDDDNGPSPLSWESRLRIATEIAEAITYLHTFTSRPIVHRDIKLQNIILDNQDVARLFGFSLCIQIPIGQTHAELGVLAGTIWYSDPECIVTKQVSEKTDVYGFGIVLLEILTGKSIQNVWIDYCKVEDPSSLHRNMKSLVEQEGLLRQILDPVIVKEGVIHQQLEAYADVAIRCINQKEDERPTMIEVAKELRRIWKTLQ